MERQENNIKNRDQGFKEKYPAVSMEKDRIRAWQVKLDSGILMSE